MPETIESTLSNCRTIAPRPETILGKITRAK
jgi:hypothetical protein